ncbi:hypothetical protein EOL96_03465 [Candidatus Saccharibacteria bacterium]|nr:hypothetical protein [Candidatus Saccharibacteria bacterium]
MLSALFIVMELELFTHESEKEPTGLDYFSMHLIDLPTIIDLGGLGVASSGKLMFEKSGYQALESHEALMDAAVLDMQQRFCDEYGILPIPSRSSSLDQLSIATPFVGYEVDPDVNLYAQDEAEYDSGVFNARGWASRCVSMIGVMRLKKQSELGRVEGHEAEALRYISKAAFDYRIGVRWGDFLPLLEHASTELLRTVIGEGEGYTLLKFQQVLPPDFTLDQACVDSMLQNTKTMSLFEWIDKIDPTVSLQGVVDKMATKSNAHIIVEHIDRLPKEIMVPIECIEKAISLSYAKEVIELVRADRVKYPDKRTLANTLLKSFQTRRLVFELGLIDEMDGEEIEELISNGNLSIDGLLVNAESITATSDVEWLKGLAKKHIDDIHYESMAKMPQLIQSIVFDVYYENDPGEIPDIVMYFSRLREDQYSLLLDRYSATIKNYHTYEVVSSVFSTASQAIEERLKQEIWPVYVAREKMRSESSENNAHRSERRAAELSYYSNSGDSSYRMHAYGYDERLSDEQVITGLELEHCVKRVAPIRVQATDTSRTGIIECVANRLYSIGTDGETLQQGGGDIVRVPEHEALAQYIHTMQQLEQLAKETRSAEANYMHDLIENLTFIGEPEYEEATRGIATYWKHLLDTNPALQLYIIKGAISNGGKTKSDEYMFDRILAYFSDEEMVEYKGRLIIDPNDIASNDPNNIRTILLDDWTISGSQMRAAARIFLSTFPHLLNTLEIQLIAATEERVALGLEGIHALDGTHKITIEQAPIAVRAYYMANRLEGPGDARVHGGLITGAHSAVDYGFETTIARSCLQHTISMPPITNIIRPYRTHGYTSTNLERHARHRARS